MSRKSDADNRSNQLNPNNDAYWSSRGESRPSDDDEPPPNTPPAAPATGNDKK